MGTVSPLISAAARSRAWRVPPDTLLLAEDEVHVWRVPLDRIDTRAPGDTLTTDELQRAARFHFKRDREHFLAARTALRAILGRYLDVAPALVHFSYGAQGKPALAGESNAASLCFNVSHSHDVALYAFARGRELGVDIEYMRRDLEYMEIAQRFFSPRERSALHSLSKEQRQAAFYACWTRKEAYIKARGLGLLIALDRFDVSLLPGETAVLLATHDAAQEAQRWSLQELLPGADYAAALAVEGHDWRLCSWQWPAEPTKLKR